MACACCRYTPLHSTAGDNNIDAVKALLAAPGINPAATNKYGYTALHTSCTEVDSPDSVQSLLGTDSFDVRIEGFFGGFFFFFFFVWVFGVGASARHGASSTLAECVR